MMNQSKWTRIALGLFSLAVLMGNSCATDSATFRTRSSSTIPTDEISAYVTAIAADVDGLVVSATLETLDYDVRLSGGDALIAIVSDPVTGARLTLPLVEDETSDTPRYRRSFPSAHAGTRVELLFDRRATGQADARNATVTLPAPFQLGWVETLETGVPAALVFSRSEDTPRFLTWNPTSAPSLAEDDILQFSVTGDCIVPYQGTIDWVGGERGLDLRGVLRDRDPDAAPQTCALDVELALLRVGRGDGHFSSSRVQARQVRNLVLLARP